MAKIEKIRAREILDSRGNPTVQAEVYVKGGAVGVASVPSGASTGAYEDFELRDGDEKRYGGKGVLQAVKNVTHPIQAALLGKDAGRQANIDQIMLELDGTRNERRLGANAILAVSLACARAEAEAQGLPLYLYLQQLYSGAKASLPIPHLNVMNGGRHAGNKLAVQEFQVLPIGADNFHEALRMGVEVFHALRDLLQQAGMPVGLGDEGGFDPGITGGLDETEEALTFLTRAIELAGYTPGVEVALGIDVAASEFYEPSQQIYTIDDKQLSPADLADVYSAWRQRYPLISIEDPFHEDAWSDWKNFTAQEGKKLQIVGDDFFVTSAARIQKGIQEKAANAVLMKPNQAGTLTETLQAITVSQKSGFNTIISHRSGETADTFIADLAVATGAGQIKAGAPARSERVEKYNQLLVIEEAIQAPFSRALDEYAIPMQERYYSVE